MSQELIKMSHDGWDGSFFSISQKKTKQINRQKLKKFQKFQKKKQKISKKIIEVKKL
jgi:hypothetical protein